MAKTDFGDVVDIPKWIEGVQATLGLMIRTAKEAEQATLKALKVIETSSKKLRQGGGAKDGTKQQEANKIIREGKAALDKLNASRNTQIELKLKLEIIEKKEQARRSKAVEQKKKNAEADRLLFEATKKVVEEFKKESNAVNALDKQMTHWQKNINELTKTKSVLNSSIKKGIGNQTKNAQALQRINVQLTKYRSKMREATNAQSGLTKAGLRFRDKIAGGLVRQFKAIGIAAAAAFGVRAIVRFFDRTIQIFKDFEQANANLAAVSGFTAQEMGKMSTQAKELGASTAFTASQVTGLQLEFAKLGFPSDEIRGMTRDTLDAAAAFGTELGPTAEAVGATLRQFELTAKDTKRVVDNMQNAFSGSALNMERFQVAMRNVGPTANAAGLSLEETTARLGILTSSGIDASSAGTSLRNMLLELAKTGKPLKEALDDILNATDQNAAALELFGKKGATSAVILAKQQEEVDKLTIALGENGTAQAAALKQLDTLEGLQKLTASSYEGMILSIEDGKGPIAAALKGWEKIKQNFYALLTVEDKQSDKTRELQVDLNLMIGALKRAEKGTEEHEKAIKNLNETYPGFLRNIDLATISNEELAVAQNEVNVALGEQIRLQAQKEIADGKSDTAVATQKSALEQEIRLRENLTAILLKQDVELGSLDGSTKSYLDKVVELNGENDLATKGILKFVTVLSGGVVNVNDLQVEFNDLQAKQALLAEQTEIAETAQENYNETAEGAVDHVSNLTSKISELNKALLSSPFIPEAARIKEMNKALPQLRQELALLKEAQSKVSDRADFIGFDPDINRVQREIDKITGGGRKRKKARKKDRDDDKRDAEARLKLQQDIERRIEDLVIASIEDADERRIEQIRISAKREIEDTKATGDELAKLKFALEIDTFRQIEIIREDARERQREQASEAVLEATEDAIAATDEEIKALEEAEKRKQELIKETVKLASDLADELFEKRLSIIDDEIKASEQREAELFAIGDKRSLKEDESLATQRKRQDELKAEKARTEKIQRAAQLFTTIFATYQSKLDAGDETPLISTIKDFKLLEAFASSISGFETGTESVDGKGMVKIHSGIDGYLAMVNHGERIFTTEQNAKIDKSVSNEEAVKRINYPGMYLSQPPEPSFSQTEIAAVYNQGSSSKELKEQNTLLQTMITKMDEMPGKMPVVKYDWMSHDDAVVERVMTALHTREIIQAKRSGVHDVRDRFSRRRG